MSETFTPGWQFLAACRSTDPEAFFPFPTEAEKIEAAKAVCAACPVIEQCAAYALEMPVDFGIWGGMTEAERRETNRRRRVNGNAIESWQVDHGTRGGAQWHRRHRETLCDRCQRSENERRNAAKAASRARDRQGDEALSA